MHSEGLNLHLFVSSYNYILGDGQGQDPGFYAYYLKSVG